MISVSVSAPRPTRPTRPTRPSVGRDGSVMTCLGSWISLMPWASIDSRTAEAGAADDASPPTCWRAGCCLDDVFFLIRYRMMYVITADTLNVVTNTRRRRTLMLSDSSSDSEDSEDSDDSEESDDFFDFTNKIDVRPRPVPTNMDTIMLPGGVPNRYCVLHIRNSFDGDTMVG